MLQDLIETCVVRSLCVHVFERVYSMYACRHSSLQIVHVHSRLCVFHHSVRLFLRRNVVECGYTVRRLIVFSFFLPISTEKYPYSLK